MLEVEITSGLRLNAGPSLFIEEIDTLVIADVHWGYASSQRDAGRLLPLWGDEDIDSRLSTLVARFAPRSLVVVGDIVHTPAGAARARESLDRIAHRTNILLVGGNHDRGAWLQTVDTHREGRFFFHHGDRPREVPQDCMEIVGHEHPAASWSDGAGTRLKLPGCVVGPQRVILPAFSPWAGGVPWNNRLEADETLWLVSEKRIFPLATGAPRRSVTL